MSTASSHSPTELKDGKEGRGLSASVMDEPRVLKEKIQGRLCRDRKFIELTVRTHPSAQPAAHHLTLPACQRGGADAIGGSNALAEGRVDLAEAGPLRPLLLPTVQHQLVEMWGAVNGSGQPETVLNGLYHLHAETGNRYQVRYFGTSVFIALLVKLDKFSMCMVVTGGQAGEVNM